MLTENESNLLTKNESDTLITDTDNTEQIETTLEKDRDDDSIITLLDDFFFHL